MWKIFLCQVSIPIVPVEALGGRGGERPLASYDNEKLASFGLASYVVSYSLARAWTLCIPDS